MYNYPFNPLGKHLDTVVPEDLARLRQVAEGWYVDYKSTGLVIAELAKHMSAFANQYGGWLYFGVQEDSDGSRLADTFPGISITESHELSLRLREATSAHISPPLLYEEHLVHGPCDAIGLPAGRGILIVGIPQGVDPPYIHSSGRIYRRLADQSKPEAEKDRHALDLLFERGKLFRERVTERLRRTPELRPEQSESSFAFIYLAPDLRLPSPKKNLSLDQFRDICRNKNNDQGVIGIPLDQIRAAENGFVGRQAAGNNPEFALAGVRWWHNGIARLDIPVNSWPSSDFLHQTTGYKYKHSREFSAMLEAQKLSSRNVCDFSFLVQSLAALTNLYMRLREITEDSRPLYAALEMRNLFYRVPFVNLSGYIARCKEDGIPLLTERTIVFPERPYFDNMIVISDDHTTEENSASPPPPAMLPYVRVAVLIHRMLSSVGIVASEEELLDPELYAHPLTPYSAE